MRRRELLVGASAVAGWPMFALAQLPKLPIVAFVNGGSAETSGREIAAFQRGLADNGIITSQAAIVEFYWLEGRYDRLPAIMADLVNRNVDVIVAPGGIPAIAAKAATSKIPIIFGVGEDPVLLGLVTSLSKPGGNATGINFFNREVTSKRLALLRETLPKAVHLAVLVNPANAKSTETTLKEVHEASPALGFEVQIFNASTIGEIDATFNVIEKVRPEALIVGGDNLFNSRISKFAEFTKTLRLPSIYVQRDFVVAGGLMSYGTDLTDMHRQVGVYCGKVLLGAKPSDLPVNRLTKFELVINLKTAETLGVAVPHTMLAVADEVIE